MEKVAATIPHLFYDLLARVIPGCYLLLLCERLGFLSVRQIAIGSEATNFVDSLLDGVAFVILGYVGGWVLGTFSMSRLWSRISNRINFLPLVNYFPDPGRLQRAKYYAIKAKNEASGFRILKLGSPQICVAGKTVHPNLGASNWMPAQQR